MNEGVYGEAAGVYDLLYDGLGKDYGSEAGRLAELVRARCPGAGTWLDVACGTGRHLERLAGLGFEVAGLDLSPAMLDEARRRVGPGVALHEGSLVDFELGAQFDVVSCLFSSIGYVTGPEQLRAAFATMARHVRPGGVLVVEPWLTPEVWVAGRVGHDVAEGDGLTVVRMARSGLDGAIATFEMQYLVGGPSGIRHHVEQHRMFLAEPEEYVEAATATGFAAEFLWGVFDFGHVDRGLVVAVAPCGSPG